MLGKWQGLLVEWFRTRHSKDQELDREKKKKVMM